MVNVSHFLLNFELDLCYEDMAWFMSHTSYLILNWTFSAEDMAWLMSHTSYSEKELNGLLKGDKEVLMLF